MGFTLQWNADHYSLPDLAALHASIHNCEQDVCEKLAKHGEALAAWHQQQQERLQLHQLQQQHNGLDPRTGLHVEEGGDQEQWEAAVRTTLALLRALRVRRARDI